MESLHNDQIGIAMTNSTAAVAPLWGRERRLGTNPIAVAFPGDKEPPVVIDLATSTVALGEIEIANRRNRDIPAVWAIDKNGSSTVTPTDVLTGGSIRPLGYDRSRGGHKGYCLSSMVDILSGVLSGAAWGPYTPPFEPGRTDPVRIVGEGIGHFFGALRIDGFADLNTFRKEVDYWIKTFRETRSASGVVKVSIPGDPEREHLEARLQTGVPVDGVVVSQLRILAEETGIDLPQPIQDSGTT